MERLIVCRHAESIFNEQGVLNGDPSVPGGLTVRGERQARELGERLRVRPIDLCVTTVFERAVRTADLALAGRDVARLVIPELNDPPLGAFELRPGAEFREWQRTNGTDAVIPGTPLTLREARDRMRAGFFELVSRPEQTIFAVLHGWFVGWVLVSAGRRPPDDHELGVAYELTVGQAADALRATGEDVFARYDLP